MKFNLNRILFLLISVSFLIPSLANSQPWDISFSKKILGTSNTANSRNIDFSNISVEVRKSIWSVGIQHDTYDFYDEVAIVAYSKTPPLVNKMAGNSYKLNYLGISGGISLPFFKYLRYEGGFSINALINSNVKVLPDYNFQTGYIYDRYYDLSKSELYFSNKNIYKEDKGLLPLTLGFYQRVYGKFPVYKQFNFVSSFEYQHLITPMIFYENYAPAFFDKNYVGVTSLFLFSFGMSYSF